MRHKFKCLDPDCLQMIDGIACENPDHQASAAERIAAMEAGIPPFEIETSRQQMAEDRLTEKPLGFMSEGHWNGA